MRFIYWYYLLEYNLLVIAQLILYMEVILIRSMPMSAHNALLVAGIIFCIVSFTHLLRLLFKFEIVIAGKKIPMWASIIGFFLPLCLSFWMFMASGSLS